MEDRYLLGIDIGTFESKGTLTRIDGQVRASTAVGHEMSIPKPGWAEHDAESVWWHDFVYLCREMLSASSIDPAKIEGVGVSAIAPCVLPVDKDGRPLRPGILYGVDTRASQEIQDLEEAIGRQVIFDTCGSHLSAQAAGPKILWIKNNEPQVWDKTQKILTGSGYLVYKLTGQHVIDIYTAVGYAPFMDVHKIAWNQPAVEAYFSLDKLPEMLWSTQVAGRVTRQASQDTGLAEGTPVIAGTADAAAEALSTGLSETGDLMLMYGSTIFLIQKTDRLIATEKLWSAVFLEPETYAVLGGMSTSGSLTRWFRDNLAPHEMAAESSGGQNAYTALAELAAGSPIGSNGLVLLPYFSGERTPINDPRARGLIIGLTLSHTRADMYRAVLEGIGFGTRHNIDIMRQTGVPPRRILAVGGGTKNPLWLQIVSDIAGIEQYVPDQSYGASYGDAFMAGIGTGRFKDTTQSPQWVTHSTVVVPDPEAQLRYEPYYQIYRELYTRTAGAMHKLAELAQ